MQHYMTHDVSSSQHNPLHDTYSLDNPPGGLESEIGTDHVYHVLKRLDKETL